MILCKLTHLVLFQLLILSIKLSNTISCPEIEKQSLLSLKQSLHDPYNQLSSWDAEVDCCKWKHVICNNFTSHVTKLHLRGESYLEGLSGKINPSLLNLRYLTLLDLSHNNFTGDIIPSFIGSFAKLEHLDLSDAGFVGKIPYSIGNLSNLHYLNLQSYFDIPLRADSLEWLRRLQKMEYLNMNGADMSRAVNWATVINSLPSLLELNFSGCSLDFMSTVNHVNLSTSLKRIDISDSNLYAESFRVPRWLFQINTLLHLDLGLNFFTGPIPTSINATKLQYIDLSNNRFNSSIPDRLYFCKELEFLNLGYNQFLQGEISESVGNLTSLQSLVLSGNLLSGKLPKQITNLCILKTLDLSSNELHGELQDSFVNMSDCFLGSLIDLTLRENKLSGYLTEQVGGFKSLQYLDLAFNSLSGAIPHSIGNLSSLKYLSLEDNNFDGNIPEALGHLSNLEILEIQNNKLEGMVSESHFANLSKLVTFYASRNHLTLDVGQDWIPPIQLEDLRLGSWSLGRGSDIPSWLQMQKNITVLDLSDTGISGSSPPWFLNIYYLNVSHNNLSGKIPQIGSLSKAGLGKRVSQFSLDLSHNFFTGGISDLVCDKPQEYYGLGILLLEGNRLSGELPDCWNKWPSLIILRLGDNRMTGSIPKSIWFLESLVSLSLQGNKFSGRIPLTMINNTNLLKIDLSHNNLDGSIPTWMGTSLASLKILLLRSNKLSGEISPNLCNLQNLQILDLSNNQFSGVIPKCVSNFTAMATKRVLSQYYIFRRTVVTESASVVTKGVELEYSTTLSLVTNIDLSLNNLSGDIPKELTSLVELRSLNLSGNHFTGPIPESIGDMKQLESLDFSQNSLSGHIPNGFRLLSYLNHLNLSFNKLTGRIPESTQLQSLDGSSFIGNDLCGPPLSNCSSGGDGHETEEKEGDEISEKEWLYILLSLGYAAGFSAACTALVLKRSWRDAYFELLECMWNKIYVYLYIKWGTLIKSDASNRPS